MNKFRNFGIYLDSIIERDPAVNSRVEVMICHPCVFLIAKDRLNHKLYLKGYRLTARFLSQISRFFTGIEIHPGANLTAVRKLVSRIEAKKTTRILSISAS